MKLIFIAVTAVMFIYTATTVAVSDSFWNSLPGIITSVFSGVGVLLGIYLTYRVTRMNTKVNTVVSTVDTVAGKVDGLLEKKAIADEAIGAKKATDAAAKEKAVGDERELKSIKEQQLKDTPTKP